jgi:hypothetical protein
MTYRVIQLATGEAFAAFARHQLAHAVAAALDLAGLLEEQFHVASADAVLFTTPATAKTPITD